MLKILYGLDKKKVDITSKFCDLFVNDYMLIKIPTSTNFNKIFGNPCPKNRKKKKIQINFNGHSFSIEEDATKKKKFIIDLSYYIKLNGLEIFYGSYRKKINITSKFRKKFIKNLVNVKIPKLTNFNKLFGDPDYGIVKLIDIHMGNIINTVGENEPKKKEIKFKINVYGNQLSNIISNNKLSQEHLKLYERLFCNMRPNVKNILFVINNNNSINFIHWKNYFPNLKLHIFMINNQIDIVKGDKESKDCLVNYYDFSKLTQVDFINKEFRQNNNTFDIIINKIPYQSSKKFIELYSPLLKEDGFLLVENIMTGYCFRNFIKYIPVYLEHYLQTIDLRTNDEPANGFTILLNKNNSYFYAKSA